MKQKNPIILSDNSILSEEVHPNDVRNDDMALKTVINGKRDVGFIELSPKNSAKIIKHNIGVLPVRMVLQNSMMVVIYRNREKGLRLQAIARKHEGYLSDKDPSEAREIGRLLGYTEQSIEEYVNKKYDKKIPIRTDTPDDYDYLHESTAPQLNKKVIEVVKDEEGNEVKICTVSGVFVKGKNPGLDFIQFVEGGHHYVDSYPGYKKHIPEDEGKTIGRQCRSGCGQTMRRSWGEAPALG